MRNGAIMSKYEFDTDLKNNNESHSIILNQIKPNSTVLEFGASSGTMTST